MKSERSSESSRRASPTQKPSTSAISEMLTPSEIESLRQDKKEASAYFRRLYSKLRPPQ